MSERPLSDDAIANQDRLEAIAEDRAYVARYGGTDQDADMAADRAEQRRHDSNDRFADWDARRLYGGRS